MSKVADTSAKAVGAGVRLAPHGAANEVLDEARSAEASRVTVMDVLRFLAVSAYLGLAFLFLVATRKLRPGNPIKNAARWVRYQLFYRVRQPRVLIDFAADSGHCYVAPVSPRIPSDCESSSRVQVYEDGVPLPQPHADHQVVRRQGRGAYSHWAGAVYLSTSDNSDPRSNGRTYTYKEV
jgi:hypothetical protein